MTIDRKLPVRLWILQRIFDRCSIQKTSTCLVHIDFPIRFNYLAVETLDIAQTLDIRNPQARRGLVLARSAISDPSTLIIFVFWFSPSIARLRTDRPVPAIDGITAWCHPLARSRNVWRILKKLFRSVGDSGCSPRVRKGNSGTQQLIEMLHDLYVHIDELRQ